MTSSWSTVATIVYVSCYVVLLLFISCCTREDSKNLSKSKWLSQIWNTRGLYSPILVHIYDTSTDINWRINSMG